MRKKKLNVPNLLIHIFFVVLCICMIYPFVCIFSVSLMSSEEITASGFSLWPKIVTFNSYRYIFSQPASILKAFGTTAFVALMGTIIGVMVTSMYAYAISRKSFPLRRIFAFVAMFTMYFSGGMAASYIVNVSILNLKNNILVLILPLAFSTMNMIIIRSFFEQLPYGLVESAKIDGANEYRTYFQIMLPLAKPALATVAITLFVNYWNSYYEAMMYMDTGTYVTLQLMLQRMMEKVDFVKQFAGTGMVSGIAKDLPSEGMRMAMCMITVFPTLCIFPFFQKYFVKGMAIGSVKG